MGLFVFVRRKQQKRAGESEEPLRRNAGVTVLRRGEGRELEVRYARFLNRNPPDENVPRKR